MEIVTLPISSGAWLKKKDANFCHLVKKKTNHGPSVN